MIIIIIIIVILLFLFLFLKACFLFEVLAFTFTTLRSYKTRVYFSDADDVTGVVKKRGNCGDCDFFFRNDASAAMLLQQAGISASKPRLARLAY